MTIERVETAIIGGGQAGLTMSHCLTQRGRPHIILERYRIAERWRSERWDSLRFQFPNWSMRLPDFPYAGDDPDGFAPREQVIRFIEAYAAFVRAPIRTGVEVTTLRRAADANGFLLDTNAGTITAESVVIATGPYQRPAIPAAATGLGGTFQLGASGYRNPNQLPLGGVLVVGAGASGCQIAEDLMQAGRPVFLSVGPHRRVPRRYRDRDIIWWINALGLDDKITDAHSVRQPPLLISGAGGGHTIDLRALAAAGMVLLGRLQNAHDGIVSFAADLAANLLAGDESYAAFIRAADAHVCRTGLDLPEQPFPTDAYPTSDRSTASIETLDLRAAGITTVIWATGYQYDFGWINLDVFAATDDPTMRVPVHRRGVTATPGAYFLGLPFLHKTKSSFLSGVGEDAAYLADQIVSHQGHRV